MTVSVPYEITLLSNRCNHIGVVCPVSVPYEITLLSNAFFNFIRKEKVSVPYEITLLSNTGMINHTRSGVSVPYEITLLSNPHLNIACEYSFQYLMKLHYSQTNIRLYGDIMSFSTL